MADQIVMSSGHSLYVRGAHNIIDEVNEARRVVDQASKYLRELGCTVHTFYDNTSKTVRDNINTIVRYHNSKSRDLDVSVHFNAASKTNDPRGVEVLYVNDRYKDLAEEVSVAITKASGLKNRGAKKRTNLGFLNGTHKPALLLEICFVDSKADVDIYKAKFDEICKAIAETIAGKKLTVKPKPAPPTQKLSSKSVQIKTGGLSPEMVEEVTKYFKDKGWWAQVQFTTDGKNPRALTGGLDPSMRQDFEKWLNDRNWWYETL